MICLEVCEALEWDCLGYPGPLRALSLVGTAWALPWVPSQTALFYEGTQDDSDPGEQSSRLNWLGVDLEIRTAVFWGFVFFFFFKNQSFIFSHDQNVYWQFPGGSVVWNQCCPCQGPWFPPCWGSYDPTKCAAWPKEKKNMFIAIKKGK